jgi:hypothetical protein
LIEASPRAEGQSFKQGISEPEQRCAHQPLGVLGQQQRVGAARDGERRHCAQREFVGHTASGFDRRWVESPADALLLIEVARECFREVFVSEGEAGAAAERSG